MPTHPVPGPGAPVLVVGAGAAGLAVAGELQRRSIAVTVLERARTGHVWAQHYEGLRLHTLKQNSSLPGVDFGADVPAFPTGPQVRDHLVDYRDCMGLDVREGVEVRHAEWRGDRWRLDTTNGELETPVVVAATGIWSAPVMPQIEGLGSFTGEVLHSAQYQRPAPFVGRRVLVVGAGNSGADISVALASAGIDVTLSVRGPVLFVPYPPAAVVADAAAWLLRRVPPRGARWCIDRVRPDHTELGLPPPEHSESSFPVVGDALPAAVRAGSVDVVGGTTRIHASTVHFDAGAPGRFDAIVFATGFRPALDWVDPSDVQIGETGEPLVDEHWRSVRQPRLVCAGFHYPTTEGWLQSIGRVARSAAAGIDEQLATPLVGRARAW